MPAAPTPATPATTTNFLTTLLALAQGLNLQGIDAEIAKAGSLVQLIEGLTGQQAVGVEIGTLLISAGLAVGGPAALAKAQGIAAGSAPNAP